MSEEERLKKIKDIITKIPFEPGIYMMRDVEDKIIYVGKAISLRKRVRQYFQKNSKSQRIKKMVSLVHNITYIVTKNEVEALVLECNYIKQNNPKFNVMLKDDKTYPYIKITVNEKYPIIYITRSKKDDKAIYFGPYTNVKSMRDVLSVIKQIFPIKRCKYNLEKRKVEPCLYYHIGRCLAPCANDIKRDEYRKMIDQVILFLQGKTRQIEDIIKSQIDECIEKLDFEKAQMLKQRLVDINNISEKQNVANLNESSTDIFGYVYSKEALHVQVFKIRDYKIVLHDNIEVNDVDKSEIQDILLQILTQYYLNNEDVPKKIYIKLDGEQAIKTIEEFFIEYKNTKTQVLIPKRGEKLKLIEMVENNIRINIEENKNNVMQDLSELLNIPDLNSIECYDISNLRNSYIVGCMIRFEDGKLNKKMYRKFKIKSTLEQNDPMCIYEILSRRLKHTQDWPLPDLILIDGGKTQVIAAKKALKEIDEGVNVYGMVKNDKHRTKGLLDSNLNEIEFSDSNKKIIKFITFLQDEIHRFTINYHRSLRDKIKK
ncbi:MAG: excinuclease ABC subunit UvrC [Clostridia bacterium]|nr:excinuclease ABC subunit UvrC [Clostridia bacterium]